jgi:hypothetical protein
VNSQSRTITGMSGLLTLLKVIGPMVFFTLTAGAVLAQSPSKTARKATGEIVSASKTTINGFSAVSGATVFNNNRIRTGKEGAAIINLGRLGRIELGPETDMTLRISEASIGGELRSSQMVVSAQKGVAITVNTAEGVIITDGREPTVLSIYADSKNPRVIAHRGVASLVPIGGNGPAPRKELAAAPRGDAQGRGGLAAGMVGGAILGQTTVQAVTRGPKPASFSGLFKAGINYSMGPKSVGNSGPGTEESFETSITCRNSNHPICRKKSSHRPERP